METSERGGIRDHKPWDWDQQFFEGSGHTIFVGKGTKICHAFGIKIRNVGKKMGSAMKKHTLL